MFEEVLYNLLSKVMIYIFKTFIFIKLFTSHKMHLKKNNILEKKSIRDINKIVVKIDYVFSFLMYF